MTSSETLHGRPNHKLLRSTDDTSATPEYLCHDYATSFNIVMECCPVPRQAYDQTVIITSEYPLSKSSIIQGTLPHYTHPAWEHALRIGLCQRTLFLLSSLPSPSLPSLLLSLYIPILILSLPPSLYIYIYLPLSFPLPLSPLSLPFSLSLSLSLSLTNIYTPTLTYMYTHERTLSHPSLSLSPSLPTPLSLPTPPPLSLSLSFSPSLSSVCHEMNPAERITRWVCI